MQNQNKPVHNRARGMVKETSRERYMQEQKEMQHEHDENKTEILKVLNDRYTYYDTRKHKGNTIVRFQNPEDKSMKKFTFMFEPNYEELRTLWEDTSH